MKNANVFKLFIAIGVTFFLAGFACYNPFLRIKPKNEPDTYREPKGWVVSTIAGNGPIGRENGGFADGPGDAARFNRPEGVAIDKSGNVYVAELDGNRVRKITPDGNVATFTGNGTPGYDNGPVAEAKFRGLIGITIDAFGTLFLCDIGNQMIRKISTDGYVSTLAGSGVHGYADGQGSEVKFYHPYGVAVDQSGNVYVSDFHNFRIRKITPSGYVSTLAGSVPTDSAYDGGFADGPGDVSLFNRLIGIAIDSHGNLFVEDNNRIRKITPGGYVSTFAGSGTPGYADGQGDSAQFYGFGAVAIDKYDNIYVFDRSNSRVRMITPGGKVSTIAGDGTAGLKDGQGAEAQFNYAYGIAIDTKGNVYVADTENHRIRKIEPYY